MFADLSVSGRAVCHCPLVAIAIKKGPCKMGHNEREWMLLNMQEHDTIWCLKPHTRKIYSLYFMRISLLTLTVSEDEREGGGEGGQWMG